MCYAWHIGMRSTSTVWAVWQDENGSVNRFGGWLVKSTELLALISALAGHIDLAISMDVLCCYQFYSETSRPCRTLFGSCPLSALGSRKADMKTLYFFSPTPYPCHIRAQAAMKPRHHGRQSCLCLCPAPFSFMP